MEQRRHSLTVGIRMKGYRHLVVIRDVPTWENRRVKLAMVTRMFYGLTRFDRRFEFGTHLC